MKAELVSFIFEGLRKDAAVVKDKLDSAKEFFQDRMIVSEVDYHGNLENLLERTETKVNSMKCKEGTMDEINTVRPVSYTHLDVYKRQPYNL